VLGLALALLLASPAGAQPSPGTIFIDGRNIQGGGGNEPFQGCQFVVEFVGFTANAGDPASATITGQPPTGGGLLGSGSTTLDGDGDGVASVTIDPTGLEPHVISGTEFLHVNIEATAGSTTKHKTVWVQECAPAAPPPPPPPPGPGPGPDVVPPVGGVETGTARVVAPTWIPAVTGLALLLGAGATLWFRRRFMT
jgi:hypothetical protein